MQWYKLGLILAFLLLIFSSFWKYDGIAGSMDSWYHLRISSYIRHLGYKPSWDYLANYPPGEALMYPPLLHYAIAFISLITMLDVFDAAIVLNFLLAIALIVCAFYLSKQFVAVDKAYLSALLFAISPVFFYQIGTSTVDHDPLSLLFILLFSYFFIRFNRNHTLRNAFLFALPAAALAWTWPGFIIIPALLYIYSLILLFFGKLQASSQYINKIIPAFAVFVVLVWPIHSDKLNAILLLFLLTLLNFYLKRYTKGRQLFYIAAAVNSVFLLYIITAVPLFSRYFSFIGIFGRPFYLSSIMELKAMTANDFAFFYGLLSLAFPPGLYLWLKKAVADKNNIYFFLLFLLLFLFAMFNIKFAFFLSFFIAFFSSIALHRLYGYMKKHFRLVANIFMALFLLSAACMAFTVPKNQYLVFPYWRDALYWLKSNTKAGDVVMCWWDNSPWVNYFANRPTFVNNQPPKRYYEMGVFFTSKNLTKVKVLINRYNISYVITDTTMLSKIAPFIDIAKDKPELYVLPSEQKDGLLVSYIGNALIIFNKSSGELIYLDAGGEKCFEKYGIYEDGDVFITQDNCSDYINDFVYIFSDYFVYIPRNSQNVTYFALQFMDNNPLNMTKVFSNEVVKIYRVAS
ncbi:hypothetical protein DRN74_05130 [Candidatus Micrarchaeota archaeon]|nr:MAG: hypothetical protein DRN74_05130 [Candidatus Micrarchaeota archaeon]